MKSGKLQNGFKFKVDEASLDDMELLEDLAEIDKGNILKYPSAIERILGKEQKAKLYDKIRDPETGKVTATATSEALTEIIEVLNSQTEDAGKNS
ncbi:MAG: hypothetical protein IIY21_19360 [Clostridiales bacterium]|jgi:hypothetical protein|nr:hypothetical protein [Clostridiales bacterium]MBQ1570800.1 hypothetical protein [Clostridiales bacterium]MBQ1574300.1 hypothetical protein [Clostridiales bacterium]